MPNCKICTLYSGSRGNCAYISAGGANILIDAGKSAKALCSALKEINVDIDSIDAIFITHEHRDHTSALQTLSHKHSIPIYILLPSAEIFYGLKDEKLCNCLNIKLGDSFEVDVKGLHVKAFPTPHDSHASVGYRIDLLDGDSTYASIGYATDIGFVSHEVEEGLLRCDAVILESNHDPDMLHRGPYPYDLKQRIASRRGHLSNPDSAAFAAKLFANGTRALMLAHLSQENNTPELALNECLCTVGCENACVRVAHPDCVTELILEVAEQ